MERSVVGLLRLAIRLLHEEEVSSQVLLTIQILLLMKQNVLQACGRQISFGLHELIRTNASSITSTRDWVTVFTLLECVGAAATPPTVTSGSVAMASISKDMHIFDNHLSGMTHEISSVPVSLKKMYFLKNDYRMISKTANNC